LEPAGKGALELSESPLALVFTIIEQRRLSATSSLETLAETRLLGYTPLKWLNPRKWLELLRGTGTRKIWGREARSEVVCEVGEHLCEGE